jgi:exodeoxyribonuclease VII small subunit
MGDSGQDEAPGGGDPGDPQGSAAAEPAGAPPVKPPGSYEEAVERLEQIIATLDSGDAGLRETLALVREGKILVEYCKGELDAVSGELEKLDLDVLVAQLESAAGS